MLQNVRVVFSKTGRARYISHLDLARCMARAVRRAGIPLWYTEGFNRHPYLTFAAPLSLGHEGMQETMDLRLEEEMSGEELVRRLNEVLPQGLFALSAAPVVAKAGELALADYRLTIHCPAQAVQALLVRPEILVEKRTKKKTVKVIDIKPAFAHAHLEEQGENTVVSVTLPCGSNETLNPTLFLSALQAATGEECACSIVRLALRQADGSLFR